MPDRRHDVGIVILSCDRYADIWPIYFDLFFKFWPDCPYPVYLTSNFLRFDHPRVTTLPCLADADWSRCTRSSLRDFPHDRILFLMDDAFFVKRICTDRIEEMCSWCATHDAAFGKLSELNIPTDGHGSNPSRIALAFPYRATLMGSLWRRDVFADILQDGETAQQFELIGSGRSAKYDDFFRFTDPQFPFLHGIKKGKWYPSAVRSLRRMGYNVDTRVRPTLPVFTWHSKIARKVRGLLHRIGI